MFNAGLPGEKYIMEKAINAISKTVGRNKISSRTSFCFKSVTSLQNNSEPIALQTDSLKVILTFCQRNLFHNNFGKVNDQRIRIERKATDVVLRGDDASVRIKGGSRVRRIFYQSFCSSSASIAPPICPARAGIPGFTIKVVPKTS